MPGWAMTYFLVFGAGLAIITTLNSQFMQLPRTFMLASWDGLLPDWVGQLNRFGAPWIILTIMLVVGILPLIADMQIGEIARAASIAANLPAFFVYWAVMKIPDAYPERYKESIFCMKKAYLWALFAFSQFATAVGVYFLALDLEPVVIWVLVVWSVLSLAYYPLRKRLLARQGKDLEAQMTDTKIFSI